MPQPTAYTRQADFTDWSTEHPSEPQQGVSLDAEFNALVTTIAGILTNLVLIQRDDGALKNASVGPDQLTTAVLAMINSANGIDAGAWVTATAYMAGSSWVTNGTGTYVCATSHTSGVFATDLAAGKWVLVYDTAGSTPADGSVTTAKLADGAVTLAKLTLTLLDLSNYIRAGGGLQAGTAATTERFAAKFAAGDVLGKIERATQAQGAVGWRIGGGTGGVNWDIRQIASADRLEFYDGTAVRVAFDGGLGDFTTIRATGAAAPTSGSGISLGFSGGAGFLDAFNWDSSAWRTLYARGLTVVLQASGVSVLEASPTKVHLPLDGTIGASVYSIGYRDIPQNQQNGAYTLVLADRGKHIYSENVAGQAVTIPPNSSVEFPLGSAVTIVNRGSNPITLTQGAGVTLRWAGTSSTGNRTLAANGLATILKIETDEWIVSGAGIS